MTPCHLEINLRNKMLTYLQEKDFDGLCFT